MSECKLCGAPLAEGEQFCSYCGSPVPGMEAPQTPAVVETAQVPGFDPNAQADNAPSYVYRQSGEKNGIVTAIKIFMVLSCFFAANLYFIPLIWCIPMTITCFKKLEAGEPLGLGFKICTLIFVSRIAGILMLILDENKPKQF